MLFWILLVILLVLLIASVPAYPYSRGWGYNPAGILGAILLIFLLLWLLGVIDFDADEDDDADNVRVALVLDRGSGR